MNGYGQLALGYRRTGETRELSVVPEANIFTMSPDFTSGGIALPGLVARSIGAPPASQYSVAAIAAISTVGNNTCWLVGSPVIGETRCVGATAASPDPAVSPYQVHETAAAISAGPATCTLALEPVAAYRCWGNAAGGMLGNGQSAGWFALPTTVLRY
jgi:hypothetical protein